MKVRIIQNSGLSTYWYNDKIGKVYDVHDELDEDYVVTADNEEIGMILKRDCEIVPEQPESEHQMTAKEALKFYETGLGGESSEPEAVLIRLQNAGYIVRPVWERAADVIEDLRSSEKIGLNDYTTLMAVCGIAALKEKE